MRFKKGWHKVFNSDSGYHLDENNWKFLCRTTNLMKKSVEKINFSRRNNVAKSVNDVKSLMIVWLSVKAYKMW